VQSALILARLVHFAATMAVFGGAAFRVYGFAGAAATHPHALVTLEQWLGRLLLGAAFVALASGLAMVPCLAASMAGSAGAAFDPMILSAVLFGTAFGHVWCWHLGLALLLVVATSLTRRAEPVLAMGLLLLGSLALIGHPADASGWAGIGRQLNQAAHLLAAGLWLGGLVPLGWLLHRATKDPAEGFATLARDALPPFSQMGYAAVAVIAITGLVNTTVLVGGIGPLLGSGYGRLLAVKMLLYAAMVGLALVNRFRLAPRLRQAPPYRASAAALARAVVAEQVLGFAILGLIAVIGTLPPPAGGP